MRQVEYQYLTKDLPLILKENYDFEEDTEIIGDFLSDENITSILKKGDVVYFHDVSNDNEIIVKVENKSQRFITLDKDLLEIDYKFVAFPFYETSLVNIYDNEEYINTLKPGMKLVSAEDEGRFYCEDLGGGQIVEITEVTIKDNEIYQITVKDQFGNLYHNYQYYIYDESKLNEDPESIKNPYSLLNENINLQIDKDKLTTFASLLAKKLYLEHDKCPLMNKEVDFALIEAIKEWQTNNN